MIVGLTGLLGAGKGTVADYLKTKGFKYHSLSDEIREEADKRGIKKNLQNLINLGNELRKEFGSGILAQRVLKKIEESKNEKNVVDSIRNPQEIAELKKGSRFFLVSITAPLEIRYQRLQLRKRFDDNLSLKEFMKAEEGQLKGEGTGQQLLKCIKESDFQIENDKTLDDLYTKVDQILANVQS